MHSTRHVPPQPDTPSVQRRSWAKRLVAIAAADQNITNALWNDPDALIAKGAMLKDGDRCTLVEISAGGIAFVLKRFNQRGLLHSVLHVLLRSRAGWCWTNGERVLQLGLRTPEPVAMFETRFGPLRLRSSFLSEKIEGRILFDVVDDSNVTPLRLTKLATEFRQIWNALGTARLGHRDMKATNFIVDAHDQIWLIDLDAMRWYPPGSLFARRRSKDLARFMKNWRDHPVAAAAFRDALDTACLPAGESSTETAAPGEASPATTDRNRF